MSTSGGMQLPSLGQGTQLRFRHLAGEGVPNRQSWSSFDLLRPVFNLVSNRDDELLGFVDSRLLIQNNAEFAGTIGFGIRRYAADINQVFGGGVWYALDDTHRNTFQQFGVTLEKLGPRFDLILNGYFPLGDKQRKYAYTGASTTASFHGSGLVFARSRLDELANIGWDGEIGFHVPGPIPEQHDVTAYVGYYHFNSDNGRHLNGVSTRLQGTIIDSVSAQLSVTTDREFDTNVMVGVAWEFTRSGLDRTTPRRNRVRSRISEFARRNEQVVVTQASFFDPVPVMLPGVPTTTPPGGTTPTSPLRIIHVSSSAGAGGDGSMLTPFATLAEATSVTNSLPGDVIYLHADSVFNGETFALQEGQRLYGEGGADYVITTAAGDLMLPRITAGTNIPIITNSPNVVGA